MLLAHIFRSMSNFPSYEAEVAEGLEFVALSELHTFDGIFNTQAYRGGIQFEFAGAAPKLITLHSVQAIYSIYRYEIPRPKALLGHQHLSRFLQQINTIIQQNPNHFNNFRIAAAGSGSSVMQRIKGELALQTELEAVEDGGDLLIRIRRSQDREAWETLVRTTPRPLATRDWRVENMPGALNATVAYAMIHLGKPSQDDTFLNLLSGSGTIAIERSLLPVKTLIACDIDAAVIDKSSVNIATAKSENISLTQADAQFLPYANASFSHIVSDFPFGQLVGSHAENRNLYPRLLDEAARVLQPQGRLVVITHELNLFRECIADNLAWQLQQEIMITLRGLHPRIFVLKRS